MKKLLFIAVIFIAGHIAHAPYAFNLADAAGWQRVSSSSDTAFADAYKKRANNLQLEGRGKVVKVLPDDNDGSRHQRFLLRLESGQTLLISHNIDLAPRISSLKKGDSVRFYGEYEWNKKGGVVHWTHKDPDGSHVAGWIEHNGRRYQ